MRSRLVTLLLLAVVGFFLWRFAQEEDALVPPPADGGLVFPGLEMDSVTRLGVETRGGLEGGDWVEFEREPGGDWYIVHPAPEYAEQAILDELLRTLANLKALPIERQGVDVDPEQAGLLFPRVRRFEIGVGDRSVALFLGAPDPLGKGDLARREGSDEILLITPGSRTFTEQFRPYDYVDKSVFRKYKAGVHGIRVEGPDGVWLDADREGFGWRVHEPVAGRGDAATLDNIIRSLQFLDQQYVSITDPGIDVLHNLGLPNAAQRQAGELVDSTLVELRPLNEPPLRVYLMRDWRQGDPVRAIRDDGHKLLALEPQGLSGIWNLDTRSMLDPVLFPPLDERARHLSVQRGDELLLDIRRGPRGDWAFRAPERLAGAAVDTTVVDGRSSLGDLLQKLASVRASAFVSAPEGDPDVTLRVGWDAAGRSVSEVLELFPAPGEFERARLSTRPGEGFEIPALSPALLDPFLPDSLRSLAPVDVPRDAWRVQLVQLPELAAPLRLQREVDAAGRARVTGDDDKGRRLGLGLDLLENLRGLKWAPAPEEPANYPWSIRWLDAEGEELGVLRVRRPGLDEPQRVFGLNVVRVHWSGVPDAELVVADELLAGFEALREGA